MLKTLQIIPESDKGEGWIKQMALDIITEGESNFRNEHENMTREWGVYNNDFDESDYDYLTQVDDELSYPAKVRDLGSQIIRNRLGILESKQARREFRCKAMVTDERSKKEKYAKKIDNLLDAIESSVDDNMDYISQTQRSIEEKLQDMEQQLQVQPENEDMAMQMQQLKANMPAIRLEYNKILRTMQRQNIDMDDIKKKLNYFKQFNDVEIAEILATSFIKSGLSGDLREHYDAGFLEKLVTDSPAFMVDYDEVTNKTVFKKTDAVRVYFSQSADNKYSHTGHWCMTLEYQDITNVAAEHKLTKGEIGQLLAYTGGATADMISYNDGSAVFSASDRKERMRGGIPVFRIWWLSPRKWWWKKSPNKHHPGEFFNHVITDFEKANIKKDDIVTEHLIYDRYSAVVIGGNIIKHKNGPDQHVVRPKDMPGWVYLPIVTPTFNTMSKQRYSMIKRVESLRELYNIIWYNIELSVVLSGVRGMVMDKSQKPDDMTEERWMYYRKLGTMWIESMKKGRKVPPSFNQFQTYDDTLSQSLTVSYELLNQIESLIGRNMGITDAALGQFVKDDPVHNVMMSNEQSSLITEIQFYDYDNTFSKALSLYLNLCCRYDLKNGKVVNYMDESLQEVMFRIPDNMMDMSDFDVVCHNNANEDTKLEQLRSMAAGSIGVEGMASLFNINSMVEMERKLFALVTDQENRKSQSQMSIDNNKAQVDQQTANVQFELDKAIEELRMQVSGAKVQIDQQKLALDTEYKRWEMAFKEKELEDKTNLGLLGVSSENEVESAYLKETSRSNIVQEQLEMTRMKIESMMKTVEMLMQKHQGDQKVDADIKKAEMTATRRKNNIKD